jgi:predicted nucleic acid-binding Zn ribbon protein
VSIGGCPSKKACELCGKMFEPPRKDQTCCSKDCRKKLPRNPVKARKAKKATIVKAIAPAPVIAAPKPAPLVSEKVNKPYPSRLALLKRLANKGVSAPLFAERSGQGPNLEDVSEFRQAQRESSEN